jgi:hypothetical protein
MACQRERLEFVNRLELLCVENFVFVSPRPLHYQPISADGLHTSRRNQTSFPNADIPRNRQGECSFIFPRRDHDPNPFRVPKSGQRSVVVVPSLNPDSGLGAIVRDFLVQASVNEEEGLRALWD